MQKKRKQSGKTGEKHKSNKMLIVLDAISMETAQSHGESPQTLPKSFICEMSHCINVVHMGCHGVLTDRSSE